VRIKIARDHEWMSRQAAARIAREVRRKPGLLLGSATGDTPTRTFERLTEIQAAEPSLFSRVRVVKLDEWLGLPMRHPATCETYFREKVLRPLGIARSRFQGFRSLPDDPVAECARMARWLAGHGPFDLCVLGLGRNGHLLFNEPAAALPPGPHVARLSAMSRRHSMVRVMAKTPRHGLTLGLADVLQSKTILLLVSGRHKVAAFSRMLKGGVTTRCPASLLWLHSDVTIYCDHEAARALRPGTRWTRKE
jgi:galactosamine-6-phosphate isomerase